MPNSDKQAKTLPKRALGRTKIEDTPIVTHTRINLSEVARTSIEDRLRQALTPFGTRISRATIRLEDLNGPRGGIDLQCCVEVIFDGGDRVHIEQRAGEVLEAVRRIVPRVARNVRQHVERSGHRTPRPTQRPSPRIEAPAEVAPQAQARASSKPNGKHHDGRQNDSGMTYALEDSQGKPSRKSTRGSSNHIKAATQLTRRIRRKLQAPQTRASAA
ncbi:MAG: hypothetical protein ABI895_31440 [Deltaproteobacteria bacterium]